MKLVIGSYVLDNVSSTAYEEFITYYQTTPASYITNNDIERWNTPADLSEYATLSYVTGNFIEIEKSIASAMSYVNDKVDNIDIPEQDLSSYATISYVTDKFREDESVWAAALNNLNTQLASYVTNESLSQMGYITLNDIPEQTVDLSSYATISYVTGEIVKTEKAIASAVSYISDKVDSIGSIVIPEVDLSSYATISYVNQMSYNSSAEIAQMSYNLMSYIIDNEKVTAGALTDLSYRMSYITPDIDLSAYVTKSNLSSYATKSYVNQKIKSTYSYITNNFIEVEKAIASAVSYVNSKVDSIEIPETQTIDLSSYTTFEDISQMGYISAAEITQMGYITVNDIPEQTVDLSSYVTYSYLNDRLFLNKNGQLIIKGTNRIDLVINNNNTAFVFSNRFVPNGNNIKNLGADSVAWANTYSYNFYSYNTYGWYNLNNITDNLIEVEKAIASAVSYVNSKVDNINLSDYATQTYVMDKINSMEANGGVDLSSYALKSELPFVCYNGGYILSYSYNNRPTDSWDVREGGVVIYKHSMNYNSVAYAGAVAIGDRIAARGEHSLAIGNQAQTLAQWAIASGFASQARGQSSIALGQYVKTYDTGSAAIGKFNNATEGVSLFTVGDGTANDARHNALEITLNGYSYISYNSSMICLQTFISDMYNRIAYLENYIAQMQN